MARSITTRWDEDIEGLMFGRKDEQMKQINTSISLVETFETFQDASTWIEGHLKDWMDDPEMHLEQCSINLMNARYRAGIVMTKTQGELDV